MSLKEELDKKEELLEEMYFHLEHAPLGSIRHIEWQIKDLEEEIEKVRREYTKEQIRIGLMLGAAAFCICVTLLWLTKYLASF
jgi:hypothetical protein